MLEDIFRENQKYTGVKREYWVQLYFAEHYIKYGFSDIEGPFDNGPDFEGKYQGKKVKIEIEKDIKNYITHKHHENENFKNAILVILNNAELAEEERNKLPETIIELDYKHFEEWYLPKGYEYANKKRADELLDYIADIFQSRFVANCKDADRDMSSCPDCNLCAYFDSYNLSFRLMAQLFIAYCCNVLLKDQDTAHMKISEFLNSIDPTEYDKYYDAYLEKHFSKMDKELLNREVDEDGFIKPVVLHEFD
jgi:hypothetical protein